MAAMKPIIIPIKIISKGLINFYKIVRKFLDYFIARPPNTIIKKLKNERPISFPVMELN